VSRAGERELEMNRVFNRKRLTTALTASGISADEETISKVDAWLYRLILKYSLAERGYIGIERRPKPSRELKNLNKAFQDWLDSENREFEEGLFQSFGPLKLTQSPTVMIAIVYRTISETVTYLEAAERNPRRTESLETSFFIELYNGYVELSGKKGLSDNGPAIRFITECASMLGVVVPQAIRRRIQIAMNRRAKEDGKRTGPALAVSGGLEK
jgi:hypothetical protein